MEETPIEEKKEEISPTPSRNNSMIWIAVAAAIIIIGIIYFSRGGNRTTPPAPAPTTTSESNDKNTKIFDISAKPFEFSIKEIRVKKGERVRINLTATQGMHDWVVDKFNARTKVIKAGESDSAEFVADKEGTFEFYCSVPTHRQQGMVGKLIVE